MISFFINPLNGFLCFSIAITFFRNEGISFFQALFYPFQLMTLPLKKSFSEIFNKQGLFFIIVGIIEFILYALISNIDY